MAGYNGYQWLADFAVYALLGWLLEELMFGGLTGRLVNRGFVKGPYGITFAVTGMIALRAAQLTDSVFLELLLCFAAAAALNALGYAFARFLAGRKVWPFSPFWVLVEAAAVFVLAMKVQPGLDALILWIPSAVLWVLLLVFYLPLWNQVVDAAADLRTSAAQGALIPRWARAYGRAE